MSLRAMNRARKAAIIEKAKFILDGSSLVAVASVTRNDVPSLTQARIELQEKKFGFKKFPNRLCAVALEGTNRDFMRGLFRGDTYVIFSQEEESEGGALAKGLLTALKQHDHVKLLGGALDDVQLYPSDFQALSKMKPEHELRAEVARALKTPLVRIASTLKAPLVKVATAVKGPVAKTARAVQAALKKKEDDTTKE